MSLGHRDYKQDLGKCFSDIVTDTDSCFIVIDTDSCFIVIDTDSCFIVIE